MTKTTPETLRRMKGNRLIAAVTAYDAIMARLADEAGVDVLLVGDSVGNTMLGFDSTVPVTLEMMIHHTAAVARVRPSALIVADVPFGRAHYEHAEVLTACRRLLQDGGAESVKIEGGADLAPSIGRLIRAGVPVCGHVGLLPQQIRSLGRYRRFGRSEKEAKSIVADARALEEAGVFAIVAEMVEPAVAAAIRDAVKVPVIGIGAGPECDGQVLVTTDLLGMTSGNVPSFVRRFADVGSAMRQGFADYARAVREGTFPERKDGEIRNPNDETS